MVIQSSSIWCIVLDDRFYIHVLNSWTSFTAHWMQLPSWMLFNGSEVKQYLTGMYNVFVGAARIGKCTLSMVEEIHMEYNGTLSLGLQITPLDEALKWSKWQT